MQSPGTAPVVHGCRWPSCVQNHESIVRIRDYKEIVGQSRLIDGCSTDGQCEEQNENTQQFRNSHLGVPP